MTKEGKKYEREFGTYRWIKTLVISVNCGAEGAYSICFRELISAHEGHCRLSPPKTAYVYKNYFKNSGAQLCIMLLYEQLFLLHLPLHFHTPLVAKYFLRFLHIFLFFYKFTSQHRAANFSNFIFPLIVWAHNILIIKNKFLLLIISPVPFIRTFTPQ